MISFANFHLLAMSGSFDHPLKMSAIGDQGGPYLGSAKRLLLTQSRSFTGSPPVNAAVSSQANCFVELLSAIAPHWRVNLPDDFSVRGDLNDPVCR